MSLYAARTDEMLRAHGLSRTNARVAILQLLASEVRPVSTGYLLQKLANELDEVTLYRALATFEKEGMVARFDFGHGHAHYELAHEKPHHHHAICNSCGRIDDIPAHDTPLLTKQALKAAPQFKSFSRHSLEFYGDCVSCAP